MVYTTEAGVFQTTQLTSDIIQNVLEIPADEVSTLLTALIAKAEDRLREDIKIPYVVRNQVLLADGYSNRFLISDVDDESANWLTEEVEDNLVAVKRARFNGFRRRVPYPSDCDSFNTTDVAEWSGSNAVVSAESTILSSGTASTKAVMSASGYVQYPGVTYLDMMIAQYQQVFFWFRTNDLGVSYTMRLYNTDGNYCEQAFTPRLVNQGQYFWLDIDSFGAGTGVDWTTDRFQYFRIYADGACTMYIDNWCLADYWAYSAPIGYFHVAKADNIITDSYPSENYPYKIDYTYDPFLSNTPTHIAEATEWLVGVYLIDEMRNRKYGLTDFMLWSDTMEQDIPMQGTGVLAIRTKMMDSYKMCLVNYGGASWGVIM